MRISDWSSDVCSSDLGAPQGALLTSTRGTTRAILITSSFRGCPPSRERNLRKGSSSMFRIVVAPLLALSLAGVAVPVLAQSRGATPDGVERTDASADFYCAERRLGQWFYCSKRSEEHTSELQSLM